MWGPKSNSIILSKFGGWNKKNHAPTNFLVKPPFWGGLHSSTLYLWRISREPNFLVKPPFWGGLHSSTLYLWRISREPSIHRQMYPTL